MNLTVPVLRHLKSFFNLKLGYLTEGKVKDKDNLE